MGVRLYPYTAGTVLALVVISAGLAAWLTWPSTPLAEAPVLAPSRAYTLVDSSGSLFDFATEEDALFALEHPVPGFEYRVATSDEIRAHDAAKARRLAERRRALDVQVRSHEVEAQRGRR